MAESRNNILQFSIIGSDILTNGDAVTGKQYGALQIIKDTVFSAITSAITNDTSKLLGITIPAGTILYGEFSAVTVTSGVVAAHKY